VTAHSLRRRWGGNRRERLIDLAFVIPALAALTAFLFYPVIYGVVISLHETKGFNLTKFVGLQQYADAFGDPIFLEALGRTLGFTFAAVIVQTGLGLLLAVLLSDVRRGRTFFRIVFFAPYVLAPIAVGTAWKWIYAPYFGVIPSTGSLFGIDALTVAPLASIDFALVAIFVAFLWRYAGFNMVLYLAAIQGLPDEYYEHARLEGASRFQQFRYVTWPLLWPQTFTIVLLTTIGTLHIFDLIWIMTGGGPAHATETVSTYVYKAAFVTHQPGFAQAMAMIVFVLAIVLALIEFKVLSRQVEKVSG